MKTSTKIKIAYGVMMLAAGAFLSIKQGSVGPMIIMIIAILFL